MTDCIFCKIVAGEIPCHKVYESRDFLAFLDINPKSEGHTLVIPKKHYTDIFDIPEKTLEKLILITQKIAKRFKEARVVDGVNILHASGKSAQQTVLHFHFHLLPRQTGDGLHLEPKSDYEKPDEEEMKEIVEKLRRRKA